MEMILTGIENKNEYYTNHYFASIFQDNAEDTIKKWKKKEKEEEIQLPWKKLRDVRTQYYNIRDRYLRSKNEEVSKPMIQELAIIYLEALGYESINSVSEEVADGLNVPIFHEVTKANGAPLLWAFLSVAAERNDDILQGYIFEKSDDEDENGASIDVVNDEILAKLFFAGEEAPRFILLFGINQIALIDRNKWNEKRYLQFMMEDIYSRHEESTFMAMTVLLHKESLCPIDGAIVLDSLDENSHKHSAGVSDALKYALRESIEILGNEVIYDMKIRQGINLEENPVDASELTLECLRYMYRFLFMLFIEARPELGYAPMKSQTYVKGYSLEGLRDVCDQAKEDSEVLSEGYYIDDTLKKLFHMTYFGYPENLEEYKKAVEIEKTSMHDAFTIEALKAHIFDPEYTKLITKAKLRNCAMLQIVDLMSISRPRNSKERKGRISYSALGINQMGAVYEALLSYRGFIAEEDLYEVKRAKDKFNELDVGYFVKENELENYDEKTERVRYETGEKKGQLRMYKKGTFIYRLAGREREKSASYYTPEVLTKCLVKYALKELLKDKTADEILHLTVCEPAMGSAAFLNEAINQLAEAYLTKKQEELGETISYDKRFEELQKVKMFIADRNVYGCDLNPVAVELAEVSLWLNTIYKGAYVPWFGTQLVNGNSLIGARRQMYSQSALASGKWYDKAPRRIMPGEERTRKGQHENTKEIYHFLLGDPGMANYTDKVIKSLEPENIKKIKAWNKEFTSKFDEDELKTVLRLSESIDKLWKLTADERRKIKESTYEPLSVYGHEESGEGSHKSIREKDEIYKKLFKTEKAQNAGPYARLKAAMDYWCALWFWPIDKADLLPSRQEFFFDMSLILEGNIRAVNVNSSGQMVLKFEADGSGLKYVTEGDQLALEFKAQYADLGEVCLDDLRERSERLAIANQIAKEQKFQHWELEFADVFEDNGGFDLLLGNPPWVKVTWNESNILSEYYPEINIKSMKSSAVSQKRKVFLEREEVKDAYIREMTGTLSTLCFYNAQSNYDVLSGGQTDLFKCFLPLAWRILNSSGIGGYVHPEGVYEEQNAGILREALYKKLVYHFQFQNEKDIFPIAHSKTFSVNIFSNAKETIDFLNINNLYAVESIEGCFANTEEVNHSKKDAMGNWNVQTDIHRLIRITEEELAVFAEIYGAEKELYTRLPVIHTDSLLSVLKCFTGKFKRINENDFFGSEMWHETYAVRDGIIKPYDGKIENPEYCILSGPNIGEANMYSKQPRINCSSKGDYDNISLDEVVSGQCVVPRGKYIPADSELYSKNLPVVDGIKFDEKYRIIFRKMLSKSSELNLKCTLIPPKVSYVHSIVGYSFRDERKMVYLSGLLNSLVYIYLINSTGKMNFTSNTISIVPAPDNEYKNAIMLRGLRLNAISPLYATLLEHVYVDEFKVDKTLISSLPTSLDCNITNEWNESFAIWRDLDRYITMVELDVLAAKGIGMTLEQLIDLYSINYPNMNDNEKNTWYDQEGKIVFTTNKSFVKFGVSKDTWEKNKDNSFSSLDLLGINRNYVAPYYRTDRISLYKEAWDMASKMYE